jgi:hypothetical protein
VAVDVTGDRDARMTEDLRDHLERHASRQHDRGSRMPQRMQSDRGRQVRALCRGLQPKSTPAVIPTATIAASRLKLLFRVLRYLGGVLSRQQGRCVQRLRSPSPLARCSG